MLETYLPWYCSRRSRYSINKLWAFGICDAIASRGPCRSSRSEGNNLFMITVFTLTSSLLPYFITSSLNQLTSPRKEDFERLPSTKWGVKQLHVLVQQSQRSFSYTKLRSMTLNLLVPHRDYFLCEGKNKLRSQYILSHPCQFWNT